MDKKIVTALVAVAFMAGMSLQPVYAPLTPPKLDDRSFMGLFNAVENNLHSAVKKIPSAGECTDIIVVDDVVIISCGDSGYTMSTKQLEKLNELVADIGRDIVQLDTEHKQWVNILSESSP